MGGRFDPVSIIFLVLILFVFYIFIIQPAQRKQKEHMELLKNLKKGDKVVTSGGLHGEIVEVKKDTVKLKISQKTEVFVDKVAIVRLKKEKGK